MKRFFAMRHAKSSWEHPLPDHDRPLNERGRNDAETMGQRLAATRPGVIVSSTAERAAQTAVRVARCIGSNVDNIIYEDRLYHADPDQILDVLATHLGHEDLLLIAHNPGLTDLVNLISKSRLDNLPTAGIARFDYDGDIGDPVSQRPRRIWIDYPKNPDGLLRLH